MQIIEVQVNGMTCGSCVASVTRTLQKVPGVTEVTVDLRSARARAVVQDAAHALPAMLGALEAAGYHAVPLGTREAPEGAAAAQEASRGGCGQGRASRQGGCCCGR